MDYLKLYFLCLITFNSANENEDSRCIICDNDETCKRPDSIENINKKNCRIETNNIDITLKDCEVDLDNNLCYIYIGVDNKVSRGCAIDKPNVGNVTTCPNNLCNLECISDINCQQCNELEDPDCGKLAEKSDWLKKKCSPYTSNCYRCVDNEGKTTRGCGRPNHSLHCSYCYENNCKPKRPPRTCYTCNGENDPNCSNLQNNHFSKNCQDGIDKCVIEINNEGYTNRRCAHTNEKCENKSICKICEGSDNCNSDIFPAKRLNCYQCGLDDGSSCNNPSSSESHIQPVPCLIYKENDSCYTYNDEKLKQMIRGCISDSDFNVKTCTKMKEKCLVCEADNCNYFTHKLSKLMCMKCDSASNSNCALQQNKGTEQNCGLIEYWKDERCFTYSNEAEIIRGCTSEVSNIMCTSSNVNCCNINGCNKEGEINYSCYKCRSDIQPECAQDNLTTIIPAKCINQNENLGCYIETWKEEINDGASKIVVVRGCLSDKYKTTCLNNATCIQCNNINCNNGKPIKISSATKHVFDKLTILYCLVMGYMYAHYT